MRQARAQEVHRVHFMRVACRRAQRSRTDRTRFCKHGEGEKREGSFTRESKGKATAQFPA